MNDSIVFKVLLLGNHMVGKTSFFLRYYQDTYFEQKMITMGIINYIKKITINNKKICLKVYDTAGQERFRSLTKNYYKGADGILLFYDITSKESFDSIGTWIKNINESIDSSEIGLLVIGNKCDLENQREVNEDMKKKLENSQHIEIIETSAKNNINIEKSFNTLIEKMLKLKEEEPKVSNKEPEKKDIIQLKDNVVEVKPKNSGGCCQKKEKGNDEGFA